MKNKKNNFFPLGGFLMLSIILTGCATAFLNHIQTARPGSAALAKAQVGQRSNGAPTSVVVDAPEVPEASVSETKTDKIGWSELKDVWHGIVLNYPQNLQELPVWAAADWPPHLVVYPASETGCPGNYAIGPNAKVDRVITVDGKEYEVYLVYVPGAIPSQGTYKNSTDYYYCYASKLGQDKKYAIHFKIRFSDCGPAVSDAGSENDYNIQFQKCGTAPQLAAAEKKMEEIVSTVSVIPPQPAVLASRAGWFVYNDDGRGFSLEYPQGTDLRNGEVSGGQGLAFLLPDSAAGLDFKLPDKLLVYSYEGACPQLSAGEGLDYSANGISFVKTDLSDKNFNILDSMEIKVSYCAQKSGFAYIIIPSYSFPHSEFGNGQMPDVSAALARLDLMVRSINFKIAGGQ